MRPLMKFLSAVFAVMMLCVSLAGCSGGGTAYNTPEPVVTRDPSEPTEVPEFLRTPDPRIYTPDENGYMEDAFMGVYLPKMLDFSSFSSQNSVNLKGRMENDAILAMNYTWDEGGIFKDEISGHTAESYEEYMHSDMNSYFYVEEFEYTTIDGHEALRVAFRYDPPNTEGKLTHALTYQINVNGWIMSFTFSSLSELPPECDSGIRGLKFKAGY